MTETRDTSTQQAADRSAEAHSWTLSLALAATLSALRPWFVGLFDGTSELRHFVDRAIGATTVAGVDASGYAHGYVRLQALLALVFLVAFAGTLGLRRWLSSFAPEDAPEHRWIARLAELWAALAAFDVIFPTHVDLRPQTVLLGFLSFLALSVLVVRSHPRLRKIPILGSGMASLGRMDRHVVLAALFWPLPAFFVAWVLLDRAAGFQGAPTVVWCVLWGILWLATLCLVSLRLERLENPERPGESTRLLVAALPWLLIPAALPVANEIQAAFRSLDPRRVALVLIFFLTAATLALYVADPGRRIRDRSHPLAVSRWTPPAILNVYFPLAVFVTGLLRFHTQIRFFGALDYFHLAENTLPTQQLVQFSKWPIVDLRLSHTFSDMAFEWLYVAFHGLPDGARSLDLLVWTHGLKSLVALVLVYFLLARIISPSYALLACLFLPVLSAFKAYYALVMIPALLLAGVLRRPSTRRFVALGGGLGVLLLWRLDFGMAAIVATAGVVGLALLRGAHRRSAALRATAWLGAAAALATLAVRLAAGPRFFETVAFFFRSYSYRLITRTRPTVIESYSDTAVAQYYLVPAVALLFVVYLVARRILLRRPVPVAAQVVVFLAAFSLVISTRSMERHSLIEGFNPYLTIPLLSLLPVLLRRATQHRERPVVRTVFAAVLVAASIFTLPTDRGYAFPSSIVLRQSDSAFQFHRFGPHEPRVVFDESRHQAFLTFVDRYLGPEETFFDFSNSPLLYALAGREFPTYVIPNLLQTSEPVQARTLGDLSVYYDAGRLPLVVFKQGNQFWDATDGVPNEIRSYRVAEWIYARYRPAVAVGRYQLWWQKDRPIPWSEPEIEEWALTPGPEVDRVIHGAGAEVEDDGSIHLAGTTPDAQAYGLYNLSALPDLAQRSTWTLEISTEWNTVSKTSSNTAAQPMQVFFGFDEQYFRAESHVWVLPPEEPGTTARETTAEFEVPIPPRARRLTDIRFDPTEGTEVTIQKVRVRSLTEVHRSLAETSLAQSFDLGFLPSVWARLDPLEATKRTEVVAELIEEPTEVLPGAALELVLPKPAGPDPGPGPEWGYLHFVLRSPNEPQVGGTVTLAYGDPENVFTFRFAPNPDGESEYLVRLSTQWHLWPWADGEENESSATRLELRATRGLVVERAALREGD